MKILAIDTATEACSVALNMDGEVVEQYTVVPRSHASQVLPMVDTLLKEADVALTDLDAIAFDRGPGSFTGIRIGTSVVQGLAFGAELPVIPVSSLETMAAGIDNTTSDNLIVMLDARMDEIYWATFKRIGERFVLQGDEQLAKPAELVLPQGQWAVAGTGWGTYQNILRQQKGIEWTECFADTLPRAADLVRLAVLRWNQDGGLEPNQAVPVYLRNNVARKKAEQQSQQ